MCYKKFAFLRDVVHFPWIALAGGRALLFKENIWQVKLSNGIYMKKENIQIPKFSGIEYGNEAGGIYRLKSGKRESKKVEKLESFL